MGGDPDAIRAYHEATKHSPASVRSDPHRLDWPNMPRPFKVYVDLEGIPLPRDFTPSTWPALATIGDPGHAAAGRPIDRQTLAHLLFFAAGVLRRRAYPGGEILYRAAACTGALYHIDLYAVCADLSDLEAGVYHFGPHDFALRRLRPGDHRAALVDAAAGEPAVARRAGHAGLRVHLLAQRLEVPGSRLSPLLLGQRHDAGQPARGRDWRRRRGARRAELRRRRRRSPPRPRPGARG